MLELPISQQEGAPILFDGGLSMLDSARRREGCVEQICYAEGHFGAAEPPQLRHGRRRVGEIDVGARERARRRPGKRAPPRFVDALGGGRVPNEPRPEKSPQEAGELSRASLSASSRSDRSSLLVTHTTRGPTPNRSAAPPTGARSRRHSMRRCSGIHAAGGRHRATRR